MLCLLYREYTSTNARAAQNIPLLLLLEVLAKKAGEEKQKFSAFLAVILLTASTSTPNSYNLNIKHMIEWEKEREKDRERERKREKERERE